MMDIGFIGLGTMGSRIAENFIKAGNMRRAGAEESSGVKSITREQLDAPSAGGERRA